MATLNSWQKLTRVLPNKPFGDGRDGVYSSATIPTLVKESCSGTAGSTTLTTVGTTLSNGDVIQLWQTRGTGAGQWEVNKVVSGGGTTTLTMSQPLKYTYGDSGASQAQATKIPMWTDVTVLSGTWTIPAWDGNVGGLLIFGCSKSLNIAGTIYGVGKGFRGGLAPNAGSFVHGTQGESSLGDGATNTRTNNQEAGGGGYVGASGNYANGGGAGAGKKTAGTDGTSVNGNSTGGTVIGVDDLLLLFLGAGGGSGGGSNNLAKAGDGGRGGGVVVIYVNTVASITGAINIEGENGKPFVVNDNGLDAGGGAGVSGDCLIVCRIASIGTNKITAGTATGGTNRGGGTGVGRVAVHHSKIITGSTSPSYADISDPSLKTRKVAIL